MKKRIVSLIGSLTAGAGLALGQAPAPMPSAEIIAAPAKPMPTYHPVQPYVEGDPVVDGSGLTAGGDPSNTLWGRGEYLLWWLKGAPVPVPIVTRGSSADAVPGALGQPGTQVLNPSTLNFGPFSGASVNVGMWWNDEHTIGGELVGFMMDRRSTSYRAASTTGSLFIPINNATPGGPTGEFGVPVGIIPVLPNQQAVLSNNLRLWGGESNSLMNLVNDDNFTLTVLTSCRYLDLAENLSMGFSGTQPALGASVATLDRFSTRNQFLGGQLGARGEVRFDKFFASFSGKVALGGNRERVNGTGFTTVQTPAGLAQFPGGVFVQPTNAAEVSRQVFCVIPEATAQIGVDVTCNIRAFVGYDFLYVSDVVRPGDQIDRTINASQALGGGLVGPPVPAPRLSSTDFWAHGINAGLQLSF